MGKKVLVTGGAGFIGSFIVDRLIKEGHEVRILDNLDEQVHKGKIPEYLNKEAEFVKGDVRDRETLAKAIEGVEVIFHEASAVGVGQSMYQIEHYMDVNTQATALLLDYLVNKEHDVKKIVVAASMSSYGEGLYECGKCGKIKGQLRTEEQMKKGTWELSCGKCGSELKKVPTTEETVQDANSIYALSKKDQEEMFLMIGKTYGLPAVALRYFNVFGPRQSLSNPYTGVAAIFMSRVKNGNSPVIYEDGLQTRDFISVHDVAEANMLAMEKNSANYEVFNVGSGKARTIKEIAETIIKLQGSSVKPDITNKFRKGDVRHCFADTSKIKSRLEFEPKVSFEEGMRELLKWSESVEAVDGFEKASNELKNKGLI